MKHIQKVRSFQGFTLVELIVVITILVILGTIGLMNISGFSAGARDSSRVSDLANLTQALELAKIKTGYYPTPSSATGVTFSGGIVWYQGTIGDSVISTLGSAGSKFSKKPTDPKYPTVEYTYSVLENNKEYQIGAVMEDSSTVYSPIRGIVVDPVYAASTDNVTAYLKGNYNGLLAKSKDPVSGVTYFLALPSIMLRDISITDLKNIATQSGNLVLHKKGNLPGSYSGTVQAPVAQSYAYSPLSIAGNVAGTGILAYMVPNISSMTATDITSLTTNLKSIYQFSGLSNDTTSASQISSMVNSTTASTILAGVVNASLGGAKVEIGTTSAVCGTANKVYLSTDTTFGSDTFCGSPSTLSGSTPTFPAQWASVSWTCNLTGGTSANCATSRPGLKPQDVFSVYDYIGNGAIQTLDNGINLASNGGLVWIKSKVVASFPNHVLWDSQRNGTSGQSFGSYIDSSTTAAQVAYSSTAKPVMPTSGFTIPSWNSDATKTYTSWSFRKAPKFFDVVTWTGDDTLNRILNHNLAMTPGLIVIKTSSTTSDWYTKHKSNINSLLLNNSAGVIGNKVTNITTTTFTVGVGTISPEQPTNTFGVTYVAYLFAHDSDTTNGIIQEGSFVTDASGNATVSIIGWEPQYIMMKASSTTGDWIILDQTRGWGAGVDKALFANTSGVESSATDYGAPASNGFAASGLSASQTYIYMVIRKAY